MIKLDKITTEHRNSDTLNIDKVSTLEMMKMINAQDKQVALAVEKAIPKISKVVDAAYQTIKSGGKVFYSGAGTSGRLGVLDASEMLPTYGEGNWFQGIIAGGEKALKFPVENAEDDKETAVQDLKNAKISKKDMLIGLAASGRTPYVIAGLQYANSQNIKTASIATSKNAAVSKIAQLPIEAVTGPETITGSTRMKSGSAQKMILNMISTGTAVKMGKTYSNLMIDMKTTNEKLYSRAIGILQKILDIDEQTAIDIFAKSGRDVKLAIVMFKKKVSKSEGQKLIKKAEGRLAKII